MRSSGESVAVVDAGVALAAGDGDALGLGDGEADGLRSGSGSGGSEDWSMLDFADAPVLPAVEELFLFALLDEVLLLLDFFLVADCSSTGGRLKKQPRKKVQISQRSAVAFTRIYQTAQKRWRQISGKAAAGWNRHVSTSPPSLTC